MLLKLKLLFSLKHQPSFQVALRTSSKLFQNFAAHALPSRLPLGVENEHWLTSALLTFMGDSNVNSPG